MKVGRVNQNRRTTLKLRMIVRIKVGIIVAAVVGYLLVAPSTRDQKQMICEQPRNHVFLGRAAAC